MAQVIGTITSKNDNWGKINVQVNGNWYGTKAEWYKGPELAEGMAIEFDDGGRNFLKNVKVSTAAPAAAPAASGGAPAPRSGGRTFPVGATAPERTINRQNALTNAVAYAAKFCDSATPDEVVDIASIFESYTTGDLDEERVKEALSEMGG